MKSNKRFSKRGIDIGINLVIYTLVKYDDRYYLVAEKYRRKATLMDDIIVCGFLE